jgi:8-oxo-dGTP pyrophosphatase MutT (NUDIX family)
MPISPYVRRLREHVGNELLLIASAGVVVRDGVGRVLLVKDADSGRLTIIGGAIEIDESPEEAAVREAGEEANITVRTTRLLGVAAGPEFRIRYPNGDETAYVSIVYEGKIVTGTPRPDGVETLETRWIEASELGDADLSAFTRALLRTLGLMQTA